MKCPICKKPLPDPDKPLSPGQRSYFPFCSDRCRLVDLNRWLDGRYQIPTQETDDGDSPAPPRLPADDN